MRIVVKKHCRKSTVKKQVSEIKFPNYIEDAVTSIDTVKSHCKLCWMQNILLKKEDVIFL